MLKRIGQLGFMIGGGLASLNAAIRLPAIFGDHMVVQRSRPVAVWGWADPGEKVTVELAGQSASAEAGQDGKWQARLGPLVSSGTAQDLTVTGTNRIVLHDVLIGDAWVCSGQSNMELQLNRTYGARSEIPQAREPGIRLFRVQNAIRLAPQDDCRGKWEVCSPESAPEFSAIAYYFGREIGAVEKVPVGLISTYWAARRLKPGRASTRWRPIRRWRIML